MTPLQTDAPPVIPYDSAKTGALRLLFAKHDLSFPRLSGHDLRAYNMMRALAQLGYHIGLATVEEPSARASAGLRLDWQGTLTDPAHGRFAGAPELTVSGYDHGYPRRILDHAEEPPLAQDRNRAAPRRGSSGWWAGADVSG